MIHIFISLLLISVCLAAVREQETCQLMDPVEADDEHRAPLERVFFENLSEQSVELWWHNPSHKEADIIDFYGVLHPMDKLSLDTFIGDLFYFTKVGEGGSRHNALMEVTMESGTTWVTLQDNDAMKKMEESLQKSWERLEDIYFENLSKQPVQLWMYNPRKDHNDFAVGEPLQSMERMYFDAKIGERFYFTKIGEGGNRENALLEVIMELNTTSVSLLEDDTMRKREARRAFDMEYKERTGRSWENYWPREPVMYHYHNVTKGESIEMTTDRTQFQLCSRFKGALSDEEIIMLEAVTSTGINEWDLSRAFKPPSFQMENDRFYIGRMNGTNYCRPKVDGSDSEQMVSWKITNICDKGPNAFRIFDFLSDDEMDHIKNLGQNIGMNRSMVVDGKLLNDRTSQTAWIERDRSFIADNIIRRVADMVHIPQQRLFMNASAESLQLVHYFGGEFYRPHHDYGTDAPHCRYITFLMYLNDVKEGGNTSFPMADESCRNEEGYFGVQPIKGSVAFFYNLFPDGNVDSKTKHQGEPPVDSEKWMANMWIWDKVIVRPLS